MARGRQRPRDELVLDQVRPRVAPTLEPPLEHRAETSAGPGEKIALDRRTRPLPAPPSRIRSNAGAPARRARTFPLTFPVSPPLPLPPATAQDFYEHLSLSEKIVHGRVKLELPHPETSDDEEEMWSRWEARNHERYSREKLARDRAGLASRARELGPFDRLELRELQRRNGENDLESPSDGGAAARRRPRSATDATYARLLSRSRSNSERVKAAFRKSEQARVDEAIALRETHESPSGAHGDILREGKGRRKRGTPPILRRGGDFGSSPPSRASSSRRVSISLRDLDSASSHDSRDSDAEASFDSDAAASLSSATGSEDDRTEIRSYGDSATPRRRRSPRRSRAASVSGFPTARNPSSLREDASAALVRARSASPARRRASHRDAPRDAAVSPGSPAESRALALAVAENDAILAVAGYDVPGGSKATASRAPGAGDAVAFGQHWTTHGEAARARKEAMDGRGDAARRLRRRPFSARATTTFRPPRLYTSSRPDERVRSRAATARAWAKHELTEAVVLETVGPVYGEPGVARHWDDPTRAAAEQAAAKTQSEGMIRHGDARLANKAARASARVAAARAARLVGGDGVSGDGHALKNTVSRTGKTVRRVRRSSSDGRANLDSEREFESDDGSVVSYGSSPDSLGVRSGDSSDDDAPRVRLARKSEPGLNAFESFRNELAAIDVEASLARGGPASKQSASAPTSPRGGGLRRERLEARDARSGPPRGLTLTQSASPQEELRWAQGPYTAQIGSARLGKTRADSVRGAAGSVRSVRSASARSERDHTSRTRATLPTYRDPARTFLRSGQGGAGMARGRSVAALEERVDPAHAARLRRQLETAAGPALAAARAEQAKAAARVGLAQARLRARAVEAADAEARARAARRRARRDAEARRFKSPLFGAANAGATARAAIGVVDAGASALKAGTRQKSDTKRRPASATARPASVGNARAARVPRPAFSASPFAPSAVGGEDRGARAPESPYSPIPRVYPAAEAARRAEAEAEAAFAAAHRRAIAESPRGGDAATNSGFFGLASSTPASARGSRPSATPRASSARRRPSSAGKHGLQLVRESLDEELQRARGGGRVG